MSEVAEQTEDDIEVEASGETEQNVDPAPDAEEVEVVFEGDQPDPKPVPKGFLKRINKLNAKVDVANTEADEWKRKYEMAEEKAKLLLAAQQSGPPRIDDFDTDADYEAAKAKYDSARIEEIAAKKAQEIFEQSQTHTVQQSQNRQIESSVREHYGRAEELNLKDYDEVEDRAIEILGDELTKQIMANSDKSHLVMYHLGKNPGKAQELAISVQQNPVKAVLEIGRLESSLRVKPKTLNAPDPETEVQPGDNAGFEAWQRKIDKLRDSPDYSPKEVAKLKQQAQAEGHTVY